MIKAYWTKLDTKQRYLVAFCAAVVLVALVLSVCRFPDVGRQSQNEEIHPDQFKKT